MNDMNKLKRFPWCFTCENAFNGNPNNCYRCCSMELLNEKLPPTRYIKHIESSKVKEENNMIVTIIGSLSREKEMKQIKGRFEKLGFIVNCPLDEQIQKLPLVEIQATWIKKIREADLVVVVPKNVSLEENGGTKFTMEVGESTSYEMAIAYDMNKYIVFA